MRVIAISGKARSGKDTTKDIIAANSNVVLMPAFGDAVKEIAQYFDWLGEKDEKGRQLLQDIGDIGRKYDPMIFINLTINKVLNLAPYNNDDYIIFPDVRYLNELQAIIDSFPNVTTIRIERNATSDLTEAQRTHQSETELDSYLNFDYIVHNNGTLDDLEREIKFILEEIR
jgi:dephospho-CoA kinase